MHPSRIARLLLTLALIASGLTVTAQSAQGDPKKDLERFQGKWKVATFNGEAVPADMGEFALVINGDKYQQILGGEITEEGTIKVDVSKTPMWIDLSILTGSDAGAQQPGVVTITGDSMTLGLAVPGGTKRPASMDAAELYVTANRVK